MYSAIWESAIWNSANWETAIRNSANWDVTQFFSYADTYHSKQLIEFADNIVNLWNEVFIGTYFFI